MGKGEIVVTDHRLKFGEGSDGLSIRHAEKQAEALVDISSGSIRDDSVFVPMGDRISVKRISDAEISAKGIIIPDAGKQPAAFGVVVGVGQGRYSPFGTLIPIRVGRGAVVMFGKFSGTPLPIFGTDSKDMISLREEEIFGVILSREDAESVYETSNPTIEPVEK